MPTLSDGPDVDRVILAVLHDDLTLGFGALLVCALTAAVGFRALAAWLDAGAGRRALWLALGIVAFGLGAWCASFMAHLALQPEAESAVRPLFVMLSGLVALLGIGPALYFGGASRSAAGDAAGGALATAALLAMIWLERGSVSDGALPAFTPGAVVATVVAAACAAAALRSARRGAARGALAAALLLTASMGAVQLGSLDASASTGAAGLAALHEVERAVMRPAALLGGCVLSSALALALGLGVQADAELRRLSAVAVNTTNAVLLLDNSGTVSWVNPAFVGHSGLRTSDIVGREPLGPLLRGESDASSVAALRRAIHDHHYHETELRLATARGAPFWTHAALTPVLADDGRIEGMVLVLNDITDVKAREAELAAALDRAEAASRAKSEFISIMSHELRTPLNGVLGCAALLDATEQTTRQRDLTRAIADSGHRLLGAVNDILEFSDDEAGPARIKPFTPRWLVEDVAAIVAPVAHAKGLAVRVDVDADTPAVAVGDPDLLESVLKRLLDNAVKFTFDGWVSVSVRAAIGLGGRDLVCEVADSGVGMDPVRVHAIFEVFAQGDASPTRRFGGLGIGLALCRRAVERMGGWIEVESAPGLGSRFRVTLPGAFAAATDRGALPQPSARV